MNSSFSIMPMNQKISLEPGEIYTGSITVSNPADSTEDFPYVASIAPYSVVGEGYDADLATVSNYSMITDWIEIDNPYGTVKPNESAQINFTITVPESAPAGGQYASILVSEDISSQQTQNLAIQNVFEIASLIYANIAGETTHGGEILENNLPGFITSLPIKTSILISNEGNTHETALIKLKIKNILTGETILPTEQDSSNFYELIMPETTRRIEYDLIDNIPIVGIVEVDQEVIYNGQYVDEIKNVVICPVWFMVLVILLLGAGIYSIIHAIKKRRKRKITI